jgi:hypothetical protein
MLNANNNSLQTFKELEDEASQLNRLDFRSSELVARSCSLLGDFVGAQSSVLLLSHPGSDDFLTTLLVPAQVRTENWQLRTDNCFSAPSKFYGQAERAISTGKLHALLRFNILPINQVVYLGPSLPLRVGRSHLEECFPLICLQRLSQPNFATQRCHWHDSWITRGSSIPVLSY